MNSRRGGCSTCLSFRIMGNLNKVLPRLGVGLTFVYWEVRLGQIFRIYSSIILRKLGYLFIFIIHDNILLFFWPWIFFFFFFYCELRCIIKRPLWLFSLMLCSTFTHLTIRWVCNPTFWSVLAVFRRIRCLALYWLKDLYVFKGGCGIIRLFWSMIDKCRHGLFRSLWVPPGFTV